jgi:hypothetical protein
MDDTQNDIWVSDLARVEFLSVLYRKLRTGELKTPQLQEAIGGFDEEWESFNIQPLGHVVVAEAEKLLRSCGRQHRLRALDSLQFASFALIAEVGWSFVVADNPLATAVAAEGYSVINVLYPN